MNLNELMPTHLEDATPIDPKALDFQYSYSTGVQGDGPLVQHRPNVRYGLSKHVQLEAQGNFEKNDKKNDLEADLLYRFNISDDAFPEFALSPMLTVPTDGEKALGRSLKFIATSTLIGTSDTPEFQLHLNVNGKHQRGDSKERADSLSAISGFSHRFSEEGSWVLDYWWDSEEKAQVLQMLEAGVHYDLGQEFYGSFGLSKGISAHSPEWISILSLEKQL